MNLFSNLSRNETGADPGAGIRSRGPGRERNGRGVSWGVLLVAFMRLLAVIWIFQGLVQWAGVLLPREAPFDNVSELWSGAVIFFAVLDLVAAVGLWLATPWGGVLWLFSAIAQIFAAAALPGFFSLLWIAANIALIVVYFSLTWQAGRFGQPLTSSRR